MSDFPLSAEDRSTLHADTVGLVRKFIVTVGGDWPALGSMIESTTREIMSRLAANGIPPDIAVAVAAEFLDDALAEATRLRGAMSAVVGRA
jgi:hypothetical protein